MKVTKEWDNSKETVPNRGYILNYIFPSQWYSTEKWSRVPPAFGATSHDEVNSMTALHIQLHCSVTYTLFRDGFGEKANDDGDDSYDEP